MPSRPKIPKDMILQAALELLIENGYSNVTIKAVAERLDSSTQPVSWHFGNMDGFRKALAEYAVSYANEKLKPLSRNAVSGFSEIGNAYVDIAFDMPNLFRYLYLNEGSNYCMGTFEMLLEAINNQNLSSEIAAFFNISNDKALDYLTNTILYSHGLLVAIVSGVMKSDRQDAKEKIHNACSAFLLQAGGDMDKFHKTENYLKKQ